MKYSNIFFSISSSTGISLQEAIYGTKTLERLEGIKETIDPNYMFDCYSCIGNNRVKSVDGPAASNPTSIDGVPPTESPTEGTSSAIATATSVQTFFQIILVGAFVLL